jgi:hypothetical protein
MFGRKAKVFNIEERVMGGNPLGLVEAPAPMAVILAVLKELGAPALTGDPLLKGRQLQAQQVTLNLILNGCISLKKPVDDLIVDPHGSNPPVKKKLAENITGQYPYRPEGLFRVI